MSEAGAHSRLLCICIAASNKDEDGIDIMAAVAIAKSQFEGLSRCKKRDSWWQDQTVFDEIIAKQ